MLYHDVMEWKILYMCDRLISVICDALSVIKLIKLVFYPATHGLVNGRIARTDNPNIT